jgi:hypothetical protein
VAKERALTRSRQRVDRARRRRSYPQPYYSYEELREMRAELRQRRRKRFIRASLILPPLIAATVVGVFAVRDGWFSGDEGGAAGHRTSVSALTDAGVPTARSVNDEGGYAFRYPTNWIVDPLGSRTELTDPSGDASVSMDVAPDGRSDQVLTSLLPTLTANWSLVKTEGPILRHVGRDPAISVGGTAVAGGRLIRFLAVVIDGGDRNYLISVSVPQERDPVTITPQIEGIVSSFDSLPAG